MDSARPDKTFCQIISIRSGIPIGSVLAFYYDLRVFYKHYVPNAKPEEIRAFVESDMKALFRKLENNRVSTSYKKMSVRIQSSNG